MIHLLRLGIIIALLLISLAPFALPDFVATFADEITVDCQEKPLECGTDGAGNVTTELANPNESYLLLGKLISTLITLILIAGALTAFIFFIIGAIQWGTAGSGDGAAKGRATMLYAAVGMVVLALVYVLILLFNNILPSALPTPDCSPGTNC